VGPRFEVNKVGIFFFIIHFRSERKDKEKKVYKTVWKPKAI